MTHEDDTFENADESTRKPDDSHVGRRRYLKTVGLTAASASLLGGAEATAATPGRDHAGKDREVLVGVTDDQKAVGATVVPHVPDAAEIVHENETLRYVSVGFPADANEAARERFIERVQDRPGIAYAEHNGTAELAFTPDDPEYANQHVPQAVGAPTAWDTTLGSGDVTIAVVDQGVQYDHPDLDGNMATSVANHGTDFVDDDGDPYPDDLSSEFHGTYIAGIAAAETNNATGIAGVSNASVLSARVLDESGTGYTSDVADAIQWAADQGADIINLSVTSSEKQVLEDALSYAYDRGALPVGAAGNDYGGVVDYPAAYEDCLAVSGLDSSTNTLLSTTNYGPEIELTAPGKDVLSTTTTQRGDYTTRSGSSAACAVVSGVAALALSNWNLTNDQLRDHLKRTAVDVGLSTDEQGSGRVDAANAMVETPVRVVEDFEDSDLAEYSFDRGESGASVVSAPTYDGSNALAVSGTNTELISTRGLETYPSVGDTFRYRVRATGGADKANLTYGVQDHRNRYYVRVDFDDDWLFLFRYEDGDGTELAQNTNFTIPEDEWYEVEVDWGTDGTHTVTLYDASGSQVAALSANDTTWTAGGVGYDAYLTGGGTIYFDGIEVDATERIVEDFEDGDLAEYSFDRGSSGASVVSAPTYDGSNALEIAGTSTELISTSGRPVYPTAGDVFRFHVRATGGADKCNLTYGVQNHDNRYFVRVDFDDDDFGIYRYQKFESHELDRVNSGLTINEDEWYEVEVEWGSNGGHRATLYDSAGTEVVGVQGTDATWTGGGVGYDAYLGSGQSVYFDGIEVDVGDASKAGIIDDFEDGDLSEYTTHVSPGSTSVVTGPSYDGSNALKVAGTDTELISTSGLNAYPQAGDAIRYRVLGDENAANTNLTYGVQDHQNRYYVRVDFDHDNLLLFRYEGGSSDELARKTTGVTLNPNTWYTVTVDWGTDGTHTVTLYDDGGNPVSTLTGSDPTWTSGGVGYDAYLSASGGAVFFDAVTINGSTTVDDFEDGDLSEYSFDRGSSGASVSELPVRSGTRMLEMVDTSTTSTSTSGLPVYPDAGDTFSYWIRATGSGEGDDFTVEYGVVDENNHYSVKVDVYNDDLFLFVAEGGSSTELAVQASGFDLAQDTWYEVEVDWGADGTHTVTIRQDDGTQVAQVTATDETYESGGIGYSGFLESGKTVYVDSVTLK